MTRGRTLDYLLARGTGAVTGVGAGGLMHKRLEHVLTPLLQSGGQATAVPIHGHRG